MQIILGVDEVGRGCWAGPLLAGAVILDESKPMPSNLRDSKKLSKLQRTTIAQWVRSQSLDFGIGWVSAEEVDTLGLTEAVRLAMQRAVSEIQTHCDQIIVDGSYNFLSQDPRSVAIIKADGSEPAVSAASILAKVARDEYMEQLALEFPEYGFDKHVGYGTALHHLALKSHGVTSHHRKSYKPIQALL